MIDQIIAAATVTGRNGLYCLGPFAKRVSFTAQQNRALNLVWALREDARFSHGESIAVVGAGLAGITAAAAFIAYGCKVDIYDTGGMIMSRQRATDHRMVHPTVNRWPDKPLSITTQFPFLDWYCATCDEITDVVATQFESIRTDSSFRNNIEVIDVLNIATELVKLHTMPPLKDDPTYSLVLLTVGFGYEPPATDFPAIPYWSPDGLDKLKISAPNTCFIVSGCGDGGLIDALRIAHAKFDKGRLAFDIAFALSNTDIAREIRVGERDARDAGSPGGLKAVYEAAAHRLIKEDCYADIEARLAASLGPTGLVYLLDYHLDAPYSLYSAPIHKLMVAHAIRKGRITFLKGSAARSDGDILIAGKRFPSEARVVIRHGAKADFGRLLSNSEVQEVARKQEQLADFHSEPAWQGSYPVPKPFPEHDPRRREFIENRSGLALSAIRTVNRRADLFTTEAGYRLVFRDAVPDNAPAQLFGVSTTSELLASSGGIS